MNGLKQSLVGECLSLDWLFILAFYSIAAATCFGLMVADDRGHDNVVLRRFS